MGHSHLGDGRVIASRRTQRLLAAVVAPFAVAALLGLVLLWPDAHPVETPPGAGQEERLEAVVTEVTSAPCEGVVGAEGFNCSQATARLESGPDAGSSVTLTMAGTQASRAIEVGDEIYVAASQGGPEGTQYFFVDYQRHVPLLLLGALFAVAVVALSRWRGLAALAGLFISLLVLVRFMIPAILEGSSPLLVSIVGAAAIMLVTLYLAHGFNARTSTALLGTLISLLVTGILAVIFVNAAAFTGLASEEAVFLQLSAQQIQLEGLLLGGVIIGALGVLDDVTVTQASAVWELHAADPAMPFRSLYAAALRIGRDHIASTVNTLVLAYAGASLPLLILFSVSGRPFGEVLTSEVVAEELLRTLVGSIGLVLSVPITTGMAALVTTVDHAHPEDDRPHVSGDSPHGQDEDEMARPRAEREFREGF